MPHPPFRRIALTSRSEFPGKEDLLRKIVEVMEAAGAEVSIDPTHCDVPALNQCKRFGELRGFDLLVIVGGDGTTLRAVRDLKDFRIPLLTVNSGTVGFLAELDTKEIESMLPPLLRGEGVLEERQLLRCRVLRGEREILEGIALNEVVVSQGAIARLIELKTSVNGEPLAVFRSDGLIVATPTGSTAYSLSAGGPIVQPKLSAMILTPINAHALTQKPIVIGAEETVEIDILPRESKFEHIEVSLTLDGQVHHKLQRGDRVIVTAHTEHLRFLKRRKDTFYEVIRKKSGWGE